MKISVVEMERLRRLSWAALEREAIQVGVSLKVIRDAPARDELRLAILKAQA